MEKKLYRVFLVMNESRIRFFKKKIKDFDYPLNEIMIIKKSLKICDGEIKLIGGSVRNLLLNQKVSKDIDLVTNLEPKKVINCFQKSNLRFYKTGLKFGCITVEINKKKIEITSLRKDIRKEGRWPKVTYTSNWKEDASRRDFTINSIYVDLGGKIYDPFNGVNDLKKKKVKFIGDPIERIKEDYLRILRFFRFSIQFAKEIDKQGLIAALKLLNNISELSFERRFDEFRKILILNEFEKKVTFFVDNSIINKIFSLQVQTKNISKFLSYERKLNRIDHKRRFKFFVKDYKDSKSWKFSKVIKKEDLIRFKIFIIFKKYDSSEIKQKIYTSGLINVIDQLFFDASDGLISLKKLNTLITLAETWEKPKFLLKGDDLKKLGLKPGKQMGSLIKETEDWWIKNNFKPKKLDCVNFLKDHLPRN